MKPSFAEFKPLMTIIEGLFGSPQTLNGHVKKGTGSLIRLPGVTTVKWLQIGAALMFLSHHLLCGKDSILSQTGYLGVYAETLYHRDDTLLYIAYVMLIWAVPIPADRWHCSLWP